MLLRIGSVATYLMVLDSIDEKSMQLRCVLKFLGYGY